MKMPNTKTPLLAAFFLTFVLAGCNQDSTTRPTTDLACNSPTTPIAIVQGSGPKSDMVGQVLGVQGIVTLVQPGEGVYIEEPGSDNNPRTSKAIFIETNNDRLAMQPGTSIYVEGTVAELSKGRNSLTALVDINKIENCGPKQDLPLSTFELPMQGLDREAIEAMRVSHSGTLTISDNYNLNKGQISVSDDGILYTATELMQPGDKANEYARRNQAHTLPLELQQPELGSQTYELGASIRNVVGVMTHDNRELRLNVSSMTSAAAGHSSAVLKWR